MYVNTLIECCSCFEKRPARILRLFVCMVLYIVIAGDIALWSSAVLPYAEQLGVRQHIVNWLKR